MCQTINQGKNHPFDFCDYQRMHVLHQSRNLNHQSSKWISWNNNGQHTVSSIHECFCLQCTIPTRDTDWCYDVWRYISQLTTTFSVYPWNQLVNRIFRSKFTLTTHIRLSDGQSVLLNNSPMPILHWNGDGDLKRTENIQCHQCIFLINVCRKKIVLKISHIQITYKDKEDDIFRHILSL